MSYIEDEIAKLFFNYVSSDSILKERVCYNKFPKEEFAKLMFCYQKEFSETESHLLYNYLDNSWKNGLDDAVHKLNVFSELQYITSQLLVVQESEVRCKFESLQRWRSLACCIGEDLLICAYLITWSKANGSRWKDFCWQSNIAHTNAALNRIIAQGISDNHFHLYGSAPVFQLTWITLMNSENINNHTAGFREIDSKRRTINYHYSTDYEELPIKCKVLQASLIRGLLYAYLIKDEKILSDYWKYCKYLKKGIQILDIQRQIEDLIVDLKCATFISTKGERFDYADETVREDNLYFSGERKMIYELLYGMLIEHSLPDNIGNLLYAYLVIRTELWSEIVQNNKNVGFENFSVIQKRKKYFLSGKKLQEMMISGAVGGSFSKGNLQSLELRIVPEMDYIENAQGIVYCDNVIRQKTGLSNEQYYYVYHFPKEKDHELPRNKFEKIPCRHEFLRKKMNASANVVIMMRERLPEIAVRVKGIDACSQEIGCRPEVFAPSFRRMRNHMVFSKEVPLHQLKVTYHVGEDFLDIVDGLRAIDEAVRFLNMRNGERFGHATVLGISVKEWYKKKHRHIILPIQDYLDNIVWLYFKLFEFNIKSSEQIKEYLVSQYRNYYYKIYGSSYELEQCNITIDDYYEAWKLRGDDPVLYEEGNYCMPLEHLLDCEMRNAKFPENPGIRNKREVALLYHCYHYDQNVRRSGYEAEEISIPDYYIEAVEKVQKEMQRFIGEKGISIEANPSSNLLISTIENYEEHPILKLYDLGLGNSMNEECPQLCVSINTDDKGVFYSDLENEYALVVSAVHNLKDENGKARFNRQEVYDWINRIRIMGNRQVF